MENKTSKEARKEERKNERQWSRNKNKPATRGHVMQCWEGIHWTWHLAWGTGLDSSQYRKFFSSPLHPDRIRGCRWLLSNGNREAPSGSLCGSKEKWSGRGEKLITHPHPVSRFKRRVATLPLIHTSSWGGKQD